MSKLKITLNEFMELMHNELTSHSSNWIKFKFYLDGKPIDPNTVIPYGYCHFYGDCIVKEFSLNDTLRQMTIDLIKGE